MHVHRDRARRHESSTAAANTTSTLGTITGAGSTFDAPFFGTAFARYQQQHPGVAISYSAVGSSSGIAAFSAKKVNFGASDVPMNTSELAAAKGGSVSQVPVALGGEGVVYNLSLPAGARLHLTGPVIARIFLGQITSWQDPAVTALNPGLALPAAAIHVVHRSDGSGTTYIFSNYLSSVDPAWAAKVGTGKTLNWPAGEAAEGNGGVASAVYRSPFSIGYVEQAYSKGLLLPFAAIRNQAGNYVIPSIRSVAADAAQKPAHHPGVASPSSTSPDPAATPSAATAGHSSTPTSPARAPATHWSPSSTGSPTPHRPTPPPPATSPCHPESRTSPTPPSSRSPAPAEPTS